MCVAEGGGEGVQLKKIRSIVRFLLVHPIIGLFHVGGVFAESIDFFFTGCSRRSHHH